MRLTTVIFLTLINLTVQAQTIKKSIVFSPDKNFGLLITTSALSDANIEWKYWLMTDKKDTILLTTAITHDEYPPAAFWSKSSQEIIFEDQTHENEYNKIKIYNLQGKRVEFETPGFIWGQGRNNFDQDNGLLFYFKLTDDTNNKFDLRILNIGSKEIKTLSSLITSGDPLTGAPEIESINTSKKQITLTYETIDGKSEKRKVDY